MWFDACIVAGGLFNIDTYRESFPFHNRDPKISTSGAFACSWPVQCSHERDIIPHNHFPHFPTLGHLLVRNQEMGAEESARLSVRGS